MKNAVLMCHAPIVIPEIARESAPQVAASTRAMAEAAAWLLSTKPEGLVVFTPHMPRMPGAFVIQAAGKNGRLKGDFGRFGHRTIQAELPGLGAKDPLIRNLCANASEEHLGTIVTTELDLDHGALVPLHFFAEAGWKGPTLVIGFPMPPRSGDGSGIGEDLDICRRMGQVLARTFKGRNWALLASGDMSHRLLPDAPAGFHPRAQEFDRQIVSVVENGDLDALDRIDPELRDLAGEDVLESLAIVRGCLGAVRSHVDSYEGPFGVGYLIASLEKS